LSSSSTEVRLSTPTSKVSTNVKSAGTVAGSFCSRPPCRRLAEHRSSLGSAARASGWRSGAAPLMEVGARVTPCWGEVGGEAIGARLLFPSNRRPTQFCGSACVHGLGDHVLKTIQAAARNQLSMPIALPLVVQLLALVGRGTGERAIGFWLRDEKRMIGQPDRPSRPDWPRGERYGPRIVRDWPRGVRFCRVRPIVAPSTAGERHSQHGDADNASRKSRLVMHMRTNAAHTHAPYNSPRDGNLARGRHHFPNGRFTPR
jgi:hypothetical protein